MRLRTLADRLARRFRSADLRLWPTLGLRIAFGVLATVLAPRSAAASGFDLFGVGPTAMAEVGARAARVTDGAAAFYNPAGLAFGKGVHVDVAAMFVGSSLFAQGEARGISDPFSVVITGDGTVPFKDALADRIRVGIALLVPPNAVRLEIQPASTPQLPYFENRTQRLVIQPALAIRLFRSVSVGGGVNLLGGVAGPADVRPGPTGAPEPRIAVTATERFSAHAGLRVDVTENVHLAAVYRQDFSVPIDVKTKALVGGIPLDVAVSGQALFDPHTWLLAAGFDLGRFDAELDVSYALWSAYAGPALTLQATVPGANLVSAPVAPLFRDVLSVRAGASYGIDVAQKSEVIFRAGIGFEPSILNGTRQGTTNLVDSPKVIFGLGATLVLRDLFPRTVRVGGAFGGHVLFGFSEDKLACTEVPCPAGTVAGPDPDAPSEGITNPGYPTLTGGGAVWSGSGAIGVDL